MILFNSRNIGNRVDSFGTIFRVNKITSSLNVKHTMKYVLFSLCVLGFNIQAQIDTSFIVGQTYFGFNNYTEYISGNYPIIIAAPHGGDLKPTEIPDRTYGTTTNDFNTQELSRYFYNEIQTRTGKHPHLIINRLARIKMDANRDSLEAAQGNSQALQAWRDYHYFIDYAKQKITNTYGRGIFLDIHGHGHAIQRIEIGYLLSSTDLSKTDNELNSILYINKSSVKNLALNHTLSFSAIIRGATSLGNLFAGKGYSSVPSSLYPSPGSDPYFDGGYSTYRHGSVLGGTIDAVQLELYRDGIRDTDQKARAFAKILDQVINSYLLLHYQGLVSVGDKKVLPDGYTLHQNYPNPFNSTTRIEFEIPTNSFVTLKIYDVLGRHLFTLVEGELNKGFYEFSFDAKEIPSGTYFYRLTSDNMSLLNKMLLLH